MYQLSSGGLRVMVCITLSISIGSYIVGGATEVAQAFYECEPSIPWLLVIPGRVLVTPGSVVVTPGSVVVTPVSPGSVISTGSILVSPGSVITTGSILVSPGSVITTGSILVSPGSVITTGSILVSPGSVITTVLSETRNSTEMGENALASGLMQCINYQKARFLPPLSTPL
ncbi:hypothetical protein Tco_1044705 [Tanacetum coccineum]|uniref:Uncharacterized protein n=1 Tax=Tanacetum coccineum TaxID=301880 RepID=A0ABQ5GRE0_9ASTR